MGFGNPFALLAGSDGDGSDEGSDSEPSEATASAEAAASRPEAQDDAAPHPFATEAGDHAETPIEAYEHIAPLLARLAKRLGRDPGELRIYDPFFCEGRMRQHLAAQGFPNVYNRNEDFYAVWAAKACPAFDVLVTNPPFSGDNLERIHRFAVTSGKPWFLLMPQYTDKKPFYKEWLHHRQGACRPAYLAPKAQAYTFTAPDRADVREARAPGDVDGPETDSTGAEQGQQGQQEGTSGTPDAGFAVRAGSFQCVWFFSLGNRHQQPVVEWWQREHSGCATCAIASSTESLPQLTALSAKKRKAGDNADVGEGRSRDRSATLPLKAGRKRRR